MTTQTRPLSETFAMSQSSLPDSLNRLWEYAFGSGVHRPLLPGLTLAELLTVATLVTILFALHGVVGAFARRWSRCQDVPDLRRRWLGRLSGALYKPLRLALWILGLQWTVWLFTSGQPAGATLPFWAALALQLAALGWVAVVVWTLAGVTRELERAFLEVASRTETVWDDLVLRILGRAFRVFLPVVGLLWVAPIIGLPERFDNWLRTGTSLVLVATFGWMLIQIVNIGQQILLSRFDVNRPDNLEARKVHTQVRVLARVLYAVIGILTVAACLLMFPELQKLGTSLLASAGVVGIILGFAAQRAVANLFAGFQLALTQPIRVDDVVIVEGEWGRIEEITLTYVVVRIWDDRRLIVPLTYFIERPFQNWTRTSAEILGSVFVWVDYTVPVDQVRRVAGEIVASCRDWDKRFWNLQVTEATDRAVQLRVLATAADASKAWNLRCEIREKLLDYLQKHHPGALPRVRAAIESGPATPKPLAPSAGS